MITFHNATDADGHIIHIDEVTRDNRAEHYYCVGCGEEMSAVLGDKREHHFRHKEAHCSWESYLHKLGKMRLKERFDSQKEFIIKYYVEHRCDKSKGCKLESIYKDQKCNRREQVAIDLKKLFDTCEEEVTYKGYRADLMLSSKEHPEREPIFLEISVTHDSESEKLSSGIQIIELKIADEKDVLRPLVEEDSLFGRTNPQQPYDFNALPPIRFFNFKRIFETARPLERFWVLPDNKGILRGYCVQDNLTCRNVNDNHRQDSLYEVAIPSEVLVNNRKPNPYEFGMMKAIQAGIDVKHCDICDKRNRCILNFNEEVEDKKTGERRIVPRQIWMRQIPDNKVDKVAQACGCKNYTHDSFFVFKVLNNLRGYGCPTCGGSQQLTTEEFIEKANKVHNNKYDYSKTNYINYRTKVCIICPEHGEFWQVPNNHLFGAGCPSCPESNMEGEIRQLLLTNNIVFEQEKGFDWLVYHRRMFLDFFLPEYGVAIECQGGQHFFPTKLFGGEHFYELTQKRDAAKKRLCEEHGIRILYYSNAHVEYPYPVFESLRLLLKAIKDKGTVADNRKWRDLQLTLDFED